MSRLYYLCCSGGIWSIKGKLGLFLLAFEGGACYSEQNILFVMKNILFAAFLAVSALLVPSLSAQSSFDEDSAAPVSRTGVRFVSSPTVGASLPSQLYYKGKKNVFHEISIGSRVPSPRVRPVAGKIYFWTEMPVVEEDDSTKPKTAKNAQVKIPEPDLSITVPSGMENALCILQALPKKEGSDKILAKTTFISPREMPESGQFVLNLTNYNFVMTTSLSGDFTDKKSVRISACKNPNVASRSNMWAFKGKRGEEVSFVLACKYPDKKSLTRIRSSRFVISDRQAQLSVLLKDPRNNRVKMVSFQVPNSI